MKKTSKKRASKKQLAVYQGPPSSEEVERIRREHRAIVMAGYSMLPRAIKIGAWFLECRIKGRIKYGEWGLWMKSTFPDMRHTQLETYVRLAKHRQFLESKFPEITVKSGETTVDFQRFISLKEADHAIRNERMRAKEEKATATIDVEASVSGVKEGDTPAEEPMFGAAGIKLEEPEASGEEEHKEVCAPTEEPPYVSPTEILQEKVNDYVAYLTLAQERQADVTEWVKLAELSELDVQHAIEVACVDRERRKECEICARQHLLKNDLLRQS